MYSPKISEDLIPILYQMKREQRKPMTTVVDDILRRYIKTRQDCPNIPDDNVFEKLVNDLYNN